MPNTRIKRTNLPGALKAHAILVANNRYDKIGAHLRTPVADAEALAETLITYQDFEPENVHSCLDATKDSIEQFFAQLSTAGTISSKDALLFYFAGHGLAGDIDGVGAAGYIMARDASFSEAELSKNPTLIKMEWLFEQLEAFDCHHTLAVMDCCFAGAFRRISLTRAGMGMGLRAMSKERFRRYQEKRAWQVLASAGPAEKAADLISERGEEDEHSPFAKALINALSGKAEIDIKPKGRNLGDGVLTAHEIFIHLHHEVERQTRSSTAFKPQNPDLFPMSRHEGGQFIFCDPTHAKNAVDWDERKRKNPYKGFEQYDIKDADFYFGRSTDVDNLRSIMHVQKGPTKKGNKNKSQPNLLVISGASGTGKSSLVKAGLLPAFLEEGYQLFQFRPSDRPWALREYQDQEWADVISRPDGPFPFLSQSPNTLNIPGAQTFFLDPTKKQVLYIDQFEELYSACSPAEQEELNNYLKDLLEQSAKSKLIIILSMRSDFEWQLELSEFGKVFWTTEAGYYDFFKLYRLATLGLDDLRMALTMPAIMHAYEFQAETQNEEINEGSLEDIILEELNYLPAALPLLSYTMKAMVEKTSKTKRQFKTITYKEELGGVGGVLSKKMQEIYDGLGHPPASEGKTAGAPASSQQDLFRTLYLRMASLSDGGYVRRRVYREAGLDELDFGDKNTTVKDILDRLRLAGLISTGGEAGARYEELIHDSLINNWPLGKQWINDFGKENLSLQRELWQAVLDSTKSAATDRGASFLSYAAPVAVRDRSLVNATDSFSKLWDTNPKLIQIIQHIGNQSLALFKDQKDTLPESSEAWFQEFWHECQTKGMFPDLNSLILSGQSDTMLRILLEKGKHWLNAKEVEFVQQSWEERIKDIQQLKKERDEARAYATAARAMLMQEQDLNLSLNLALASYQLLPTPESTRVMHDIFTHRLKDTAVDIPSEAAQNEAPANQVSILGTNELLLQDILGGTEKVIRLKGQAKTITCATYSPELQLLLTGHEDATATLWDMNGEPLQTMQRNGSAIVSVGFSQEKELVFTRDQNSQIKTWKNYFQRWKSGTIWKENLSPLSSYDKRAYKIDWDY